MTFACHSFHNNLCVWNHVKCLQYLHRPRGNPVRTEWCLPAGRKRWHWTRRWWSWQGRPSEGDAWWREGWANNLTDYTRSNTVRNERCEKNTHTQMWVRRWWRRKVSNCYFSSGGKFGDKPDFLTAVDLETCLFLCAALRWINCSHGNRSSHGKNSWWR